jgi:hypothetical protein
MLRGQAAIRGIHDDPGHPAAPPPDATAYRTDLRAMEQDIDTRAEHAPNRKSPSLEHSPTVHPIGYGVAEWSDDSVGQ